MSEPEYLRLGDSPDLVELSLQGLVEKAVIFSYEKIDGGFRLKLHPDSPKYLDMVVAEARGFCMGAELVHHLAQEILRNNIKPEDIVKEMLRGL